MLPTPVTTTDEYLKAIHDRLVEIRDGLRAPVPTAELAPTVEIKEPKRKAK